MENQNHLKVAKRQAKSTGTVVGSLLIVFITLSALCIGSTSCRKRMDPPLDVVRLIKETLELKGLTPQAIRLANFHEGVTPENFDLRTGAPYKPSYNEEPSIPAQCWIETGYGTQNACLYCHTNYLASIGHGNTFPLAEDQILYSFPSSDLNRVLWRNTIFPEEIANRLKNEGIELPDSNDVNYVRNDNWLPTFMEARSAKKSQWLNTGSDEFILFPSLNPNHLFPWSEDNPTSSGMHGYIDPDGFVRDEAGQITGWRAVNFFPYGIFTPLTGSVSGIYVRLPAAFMTNKGSFCLETYKNNLDLLEKNIKNRTITETRYYGDTDEFVLQKGFFPVGTEFAHPLHYVDLNADGETGDYLDGVIVNKHRSYEFPGTRAKRLKEMRYMYKWKDVDLDDIDEDAHHEDIVIGHEGQGWVDNNAGWLLAGFIENRKGTLRAQTTEEMMQCIGCHGKTGNTIDSVWSIQRKLPGNKGWREMDYGEYDSRNPHVTKLNDYVHEGSRMGKIGYFYYTIIGADLYGVMPSEIADELLFYAEENAERLNLHHDISEVFDDDLLKNMEKKERKSRLIDRQVVIRDYVNHFAYLFYDSVSKNHFIKGNLLYPSLKTMKNNIELYRQIVLDQSFNLGKDVFGSESDHVPFTFRSDGTVKNADHVIIPVGEIIVSRPFNEDGEGITPTGIVRVNDDGEPVDLNGIPVDIEREPEKAVGHVSTGGTFDTMYNPILSDIPLEPR